LFAQKKNQEKGTRGKLTAAAERKLKIRNSSFRSSNSLIFLTLSLCLRYSPVFLTGINFIFPLILNYMFKIRKLFKEMPNISDSSMPKMPGAIDGIN
jgi:hypothetical protein